MKILDNMRMTVESFQVYTVTPDAESIAKYEATLFDDDEVEELLCSMKATSHIGANIAASMTEFFTNHLTNINVCDDERDVPSQMIFESSLAYMDVVL